MKVKDQLRLQMEKMKISVKELSERLDVSDQTVRHWLSGRSFPGKSKTAALDRALNFKIDYSEGASTGAEGVGDPVVSSGGLHHTDIAALLAISRMPPEIKLMFCRLAEEIVRYIDGGPSGTDDQGGAAGRKHSPFRRR